MRDIKFIVLHCAATPNGDKRFNVKVIDAMHRDRGWRKIGYHYVVEVDGQVSVGRGIAEIGAHVEGSNSNSIGICMIGTDRFTMAQWLALESLVRKLKGLFPAAEVLGHRDFSPDKNGDGVIEKWEWVKTCPGFDARAWYAANMVAPLDAVLPC